MRRWVKAIRKDEFEVGEKYKIEKDGLWPTRKDDYDFIVYSKDEHLEIEIPFVMFKFKDGSIRSRSDLINYINVLY